MIEEGPAVDGARKRRWRLFLAGESVLLLLTILGFVWFWTPPAPPTWAPRVLIYLCLWHCIALPKCFLYLIGKPVVISLAPLFTSPESILFRRQLRQRSALGDEEYYARFYEGSGMPKDIPARLRKSLLKHDKLFDRVYPAEFLPLVDDDLDFGDIVFVIEREFGFRFPKKDIKLIDGTLDNLILLVHWYLNGQSG
jgi:hypothetical protein